MPTIIQLRRDTNAGWTTNGSTVLAAGEVGYETDTGNFKVGDGSTAWSSLAYQFPYSTGLKTSALSATLSVDNANDRVGIGTSSPAQTLDVTGTANVSGNTTIGGNTTVGGTLGVTGDTTLTGDLAVNGGDITTTSATANVVNATATTVNIAGAATTIAIGAATGTATINNTNTVVAGDLAVNGADITTTSTGTANVFNANATTLNVGGAATTVSLGAATGTTTINNANTVVTGDLAVNGADITTTATGTANVFNTNATIVNVGGAATTLSLGAATGTASVNNATFRFNSGFGSVATAYGVRAWVNFDGTASGPISPRASGNVSSVTDNGAGDYTLNFVNAMPDTNYAAIGSAGSTSTSYATGAADVVGIHKPTTFNTSTYRFQQGSSGNSGGAGSTSDTVNVTVAIFR